MQTKKSTSDDEDRSRFSEQSCLSDTQRKRGIERPYSSSFPENKRLRRSLIPTNRLDELVSLLKFWLSPSNLSKDRFLVQQMINDEDGWVAADVITKFNKAKAINASVADVVTALSLVGHPHLETNIKGPKNGFFRVKGGIEALKQIVRDAACDEDERTIYAEPLPPNTDKDRFSSAFESYGEISYLSMPTLPDGRSKGFAFIEFRCAEDADRVIAESGNGNLHITGFPGIAIIGRTEWRRRKEVCKQVMKSRRTVGSSHASPKTLPIQHSIEKDHDKNITDGHGDNCEAPVMLKRLEESGATVRRIVFEPGLLVLISGLDKVESKVSRQLIYQELEEHGPLSYVDFSPKVPSSCTARYMHTSGAKRAVEGLAKRGGATVLGVAVEAALLVGEEEEHYWANVEQERAKKWRRREHKERERQGRRVKRRQPSQRHKS